MEVSIVGDAENLEMTTVWPSITEMDPAECLHMWQKIRERYGRESRTSCGRSGAGRDEVQRPSWDLFPYLQFLAGQIRRRGTKARKMVGSAGPATGVLETPRDLLMGVYTPCGGGATEDMAEESCEANLDDNSLDRSLQPTGTCQVLLTLEGDGQLPSPSQLDPTPPVSPPQVAPVAAPMQATVLPAVPPHPPSRKPGRKITASERRAREDAALGKVLSESTRQMANTCKRPHIDALTPEMALGFHFANELAALPPHLRCLCKEKVLKVFHEFEKRNLVEKGLMSLD
ncbi:uncharacterized protein LOC115308379 [Ixodes scapularis]|uniref:uncharacterized protein LOC115308379 n=3 Tax=Ixodes scapularis TaxID=6945 RepID=UPI0011618481|nr:uncharacterized protein LOC115308379 [Ixodes scapularis]